MKNLLLILALSFAINIAVSSVSSAQFRNPDLAPYTSGKIVDEDYNKPGKLSNLWNVQMSHSYSMTFSAFGGETLNMNMYTNSLDFFFSERLTGDLDISFIHSPFGSSMINGADQSPFNGKIFINNAQLDYAIGKNAKISVQFQQHPYSSYGMNRYGINNFFLN